MSAGRVIFSFNDGINLALNEEELAKGAVIRFGLGFENVEMLYKESALTLVGREQVQDKTPTIEFSIKRKDLRDGEGQTEQLGATSAPVQVEPVVEALLNTFEMSGSLDLATVFHEGIHEDKKTSLTKTQRRNRNRRFQIKQKKLKEKIKLKSQVIVPEVADYTPTDVIPVVEEYVPQYVQRTIPRQIISENELEKFQSIRRQNFEYFQRINGKQVNILEGLELHTGIFSEIEQRKILHCVYDLKDKGRAGFLRRRTYSEPRKWMRGKGRITIQFGCCYNYAVDTDGNPPGIIRHEDVDPIPPLIVRMIKRMVAWHVIPPDSTPDSCIINIYEEGDCIPPHVDSHDFLRPFCTASFLGECDIMLGTELRIKGPGEFSGPVKIPLPVGSVLVFGGNGADLAKHCVPAVPRQRVSITFRKMDPAKLPDNFRPEPELQGLCPLIF